ncbi:MAG: hypothetical protein AAF721_00355 [Myxococcota bacterium]
MTPRQIANDAARMAADRIGVAIKSYQDWVREDPYVAWNFHQVMVATLPRWRVFARAHHRRQARRAHALWQAAGNADRCRLAEALRKATP